MSISHKLTLLLLSSMLALVGLIAVGAYNSEKTKHIQAQLTLVEQLRVSTLAMRNHEKDFFTTYKTEFADKHSQAYDTFLQQMTLLDPLVVGDTSSLTQQVNAYRDSFVQAVTLQKVIGLTPETGLYGELRSAIHNVEKKLAPITTIQAGSKMLADALLLRRHEKDFMLRRNAKYVDHLLRDVKVLEEDLAKSPLDDEDIEKLQGLVKIYVSSFLALVENEKKMGITGVKGLRETMHEQAMQMEGKLTSFVDHMKVQSQLVEEGLFWRNVMIASAIALFLLLLTWSTRRAITRPVNEIMVQMQEITQSGALQLRVPVHANDELAKIARSFNALLDAIQSVVKETSFVMGSIAAGELKSRMSGNYPGDLKDLSDNVNASAEGIVNIVNQIRHAMDALSEGRFDQQIDQSAPGEFGVMLATAAGALSNLQVTITELNQLTEQMNLGNFSGRITANVHGNMLTMKTNVNDAMSTLEHTIDDVTRVMLAQSKGDLTQTITNSYQGQLKSLADAINHSSTQLLQIVADSVSIAHRVNAGANQVSQGAQDLSVRIQEQASSIEAISATMTEMSATVSASVANNASIADLARQVEHKSGEGVAVMKETIEAMQSIQVSSQRIGEIVSIIDSIAFQTNLLALNAAVEAARAGEHGRGFAVVASEVRGLAAKSAEAAKDIKTLIEASEVRVKAGSQLANKSGVMLNEIEASIKHVTEMVDGVASASAEQSQAIVQVNKAISEIERVTQENAALVEETASASDSLHQEAEALRGNMAFFDTRNPRQLT
ncbi:MAG: HAMP domain-containing protein [Gammaproteobacteria bacterium]|nr:HAMP domain-containing protein [Gammaproteobacteria bacterium]